MKKFLLIWLLFLWTITLTWCKENSLLWRLWLFNIIDWDWMEKPAAIVCEEDWWSFQVWQEWWEEQDICYFDDESFCYIDDLIDWNCIKWDMHYYDDDILENDA